MNILQSWKASLLIFAPANFMGFLREVGKSTQSVFLLLISRWYLWIGPLIILLLQDVIDGHLIKRFLVKVYPTTEDPNVLITWGYFLSRPVGLSVILFRLMYLWLFSVVYECAVEVHSGLTKTRERKKSLFIRYAPFMVG